MPMPQRADAPADAPAAGENFLYVFKGAPSARQTNRPGPISPRMRGTSTESVNERGSAAGTGQGCWGLSPQVAGSLARLPLAR
jgi:hypothetical protein